MIYNVVMERPCFPDLVNNEALVLNVILSPHEAGTVTFYVPVIFNSMDYELHS